MPPTRRPSRRRAVIVARVAWVTSRRTRPTRPLDARNVPRPGSCARGAWSLAVGGGSQPLGPGGATGPADAVPAPPNAMSAAITMAGTWRMGGPGYGARRASRRTAVRSTPVAVLWPPGRPAHTTAGAPVAESKAARGDSAGSSRGATAGPDAKVSEG